DSSPSGSWHRGHGAPPSVQTVRPPGFARRQSAPPAQQSGGMQRDRRSVPRHQAIAVTCRSNTSTPAHRNQGVGNKARGSRVHTCEVSPESVLPTTFDIVADIIVQNCHIPRNTITEDAHLLSDLAIDSLDLLGVVSAIDDTFGVRVPVEQWLHAKHMNATQA